ncbi:hypothetical protein P7K49_011005 [Saguinus oedipus]|uniref:Uncharacterized protein n=1 Tax=Saguinus oedipus TaxID=9490 RepID=A0ABQ9VPF7_SAGOE|nr:hypothetical protein P7K49_011005 [Saguinus oedipus]
MVRPSPVKVPRMVPDLSLSAHETARISSGDGSSLLAPGSPQPLRYLPVFPTDLYPTQYPAPRFP